MAASGVTLVDTADQYGLGHNEQLIGAWLRNSAFKSQVKVATKCGIERSPAVGRRINNAPDYIRRCCDASLQRLGVEQIALYYLHRVDPATALQTEYSLWSRDVEQDILAMTRALGIGFVAYSPLGRGFLSGRLTDASQLADGDFRRTNPRFEGDNLQQNLGLLDTVRAVAGLHAATPAQVALAWLLAQGEHIVPTPGTRRPACLHENLGASNVTLSAEDLVRLDQATAPGKVHGTRYNADGAKALNV